MIGSRPERITSPLWWKVTCRVMIWFSSCHLAVCRSVVHVCSCDLHGIMLKENKALKRRRKAETPDLVSRDSKGIKKCQKDYKTNASTRRKCRVFPMLTKTPYNPIQSIYRSERKGCPRFPLFASCVPLIMVNMIKRRKGLRAWRSHLPLQSFC